MAANPNETTLIGTPTSDGFGWVTAISGKHALVAAPFADSQAPNTGAVYVYREDSPNSWVAEGQLLSTGLYTDDQFGHSIAIDGNIAVVGSPFHNSNNGAAYIFERDSFSGTWNQIQKLTSSSPLGGQFGKNVNLDGNTILVSAWKAKSTIYDVGEVYLYEKDLLSGQWLLQQTLAPSDPVKKQRFGGSVSIKGSVAVVGSYWSLVDGYSKAGAAYVYEKNQTTGIWTETIKLTAQDRNTNNYFGGSVDTNGQTIVVGARESSAVAPTAGSAYVFNKTQQGMWQQHTQLNASDAQADDRFGRWVSITENVIYAGALRADYSGLFDAGAVYRFDYAPNLGEWVESSKLMPASASAKDHISARLDADGKRLVVGAGFGHGAPAVTGKAYIYTFNHFDKVSITEPKHLGSLVNVKQKHATLASLESGITMSAWAGNDGIWYRLFDKYGLPMFDERKIQNTTWKDSLPHVSAGKTSGFVITWNGETPRGYEVFLLVLDTEGNEKNIPQPITQDINFAYSPVKNNLSKIHPNTTVLPSGDFLITWDANELGIRHIYTQLFSQDAISIQPIVQLDSNQNQQIQNIDEQGFPKMASNNKGDIFVSWGGEFDQYSQVGTVYRSFNINDTDWLANPQQWLIQPTQNNSVNTARVMVSMNEKGNVVTTWSQNNILLNKHSSNMKIFDAATSTWSNAFPLNYISQTGTLANLNYQPVAHIFNNNVIFSAWSTLMPNGDGGMVGQLFTDQGQNIGKAFPLTMDTALLKQKLLISSSSYKDEVYQIHMIYEQVDASNAPTQFYNQMYISY